MGAPDAARVRGPSAGMTSAGRSALRLAGIYLCLAGAWIILSDRIATRIFTKPDQLARISQYKGLFFVGVTSLLLYLMMKQQLDSSARSQQALSQAEERFAVFMANLPVAAYLRDREGRFVYVNEYWKQHFGKGRPWQGKTAADFFDAETVAAVDEDHKKILAGETLVERAVTVIDDGKRTEWLVRRFPVALGPGDDMLVGAFSIDLTEQRHLEEQLRQAAKMEALGLLAGGIAHDFNNLLTVINGYAQLLDLWSADPKAARRAAEQIRRAGDHAALLTGQLLAFGRKQMVQPEALELGSVIVGFKPMLQRLIGEHIRLQVNAEPVAPIWADRSQMEQVVLNLVVNARDAMDGGGAIAITVENLELDEDGAERLGLLPGPHVQLTVSDSGRGMSSETLSRIFEPFFTTKERGKGTGLGLSTVYGIVNAAGGTVRAESQPKQGSTFCVYLPVTARAATQEEMIPSRGGCKATVLLVEDDDGVRGLTKILLEKEGHRVVACASGREAIEALPRIEGGVEILVTDVIMPEMTGPQVARHLRDMNPSLRVLYISGYSQDMLKTVRTDGSALLRKPFTAEALSEAVRRVLEVPGSGLQKP